MTETRCSGLLASALHRGYLCPVLLQPPTSSQSATLSTTSCLLRNTCRRKKSETRWSFSFRSGGKAACCPGLLLVFPLLIFSFFHSTLGLGPRAPVNTPSLKVRV